MQKRLNRLRRRLGFGLVWCTLAPPGKCHRTVQLRRRCGLLANDFDHLLISFSVHTGVDIKEVMVRCVCLLSSGEGMFGKVYTAVNMDTGAYMAMKEVSDDDYKFEVKYS